MTVDNILEKITEELKASSETSGVLLHGSYATGTAHPESDLDIICITNTDWFSKEIRIMDGIEVEIQRTPESKIRNEMALRYPMNLNFFLNVFNNGKILYDRTGCLAELIREAKEYKKQGPPKANLFEIYMGRSFFRHRLSEVKRMMKEKKTRGLGQVKIDILFYNAVYGYCKSHQIWADKLDLLLDILDRDAPDFAHSCRAFLDTDSDKERIQLIEEIVNQVIEPSGWGESIEYQTPRVPISSTGKIRDGLIF